MLHQYQPNEWSCLPTSLAMIVDRPLDEVLELIGHDGSDITFPHLEGMRSRRNFHMQEIVNVAWQLGYFLTLFDPSPVTRHGVDIHCLGNDPKFAQTTKSVLQTWDAIIVVPRHAYAWSCKDQKLFDPRGRNVDIRGLLHYGAYASGKLLR